MRILVLGASGSLGEYVINALNKNGVNLRLFSRNASKLERYKAQNIEIFEGDARNLADLKNALKGVDAVYAGLAGELEIMAKTLIQAMNEVGVKRLVWITSYGIYGEAGRSFSPPKSYVESAKIIEDSTLDYTIIRPGWFSSENEINYEVTYKGEAFKNPEARISRKSIADLVRRCIFEDFGIRQSLGINPK
ncbi:NAD-dependent dehydratase [Helicobacter sp. 16-1353]|nr:NAD-dependent dehydratase [Helicobacter sp. 16-1353]